MDGNATTRLAVGGLVGISALCVVGMVASSFAVRGESVLIALVSLASTCLGILGTLLLPSGRMPNGNVSVPGPPTVPFQPPTNNPARPGP